MSERDKQIQALPNEKRLWFREADEIDRDIEFIRKEFRKGFEMVSEIDRPGVCMFGSARTAETSRWYQAAMEIGEGFAREGFAVVTGGGPGIMEAGNRGAKRGGGLSVGFGIALPHEQGMNDYLDISYVFKHFYARKVCFVKSSEGFVALPGGFGTNDELFEALTLIQTHKILDFPVVLFGVDHWQPMVDWVHQTLLVEGQIGEEDINLFALTDDPAAAVRAVVDSFRKRVAEPVLD
ncbi:MAG: hypothetical protein QOI81_47 [Actinomycetota bacterium]|nr:hypothetical protein [Actinomycetota bacterium]